MASGAISQHSGLKCAVCVERPAMVTPSQSSRRKTLAQPLVDAVDDPILISTVQPVQYTSREMLGTRRRRVGKWTAFPMPIAIGRKR
jgi:hypothetical protein